MPVGSYTSTTDGYGVAARHRGIMVCLQGIAIYSYVLRNNTLLNKAIEHSTNHPTLVVNGNGPTSVGDEGNRLGLGVERERTLTNEV